MEKLEENIDPILREINKLSAERWAQLVNIAYVGYLNKFIEPKDKNLETARRIMRTANDTVCTLLIDICKWSNK